MPKTRNLFQQPAKKAHWLQGTHKFEGRLRVLVHRNMTEFLRSLVQMLADGLRAISIEPEVTHELPPRFSGRAIVLGANFFRAADLEPLTQDSIIFNIENTSSCFISEEYSDLLRRFSVWDFSERNAIDLSRLLDRPVHYLKTFYVDSLSRIVDAEETDIDVLFYGSFNDRRKKILHILRTRGLVVRAVFGVFGDPLDQLIARSKVVINIHFYDNGRLEMIRIFDLLANGRAVVSEVNPGELVDPDLTEALAATPYEQLVETTETLVRDPERRRQLAKRGFEAFRRRCPNTILREALAWSETRGASRRAGGGMLTREYALNHTWYQIRDDGSHRTTEIRLLPDGRIAGYSHPNEVSWSIEDGVLCFLGQDGTCSTRFSEVLTESGRLTLRGPFLRDSGGIVHRLRELGSLLERGDIDCAALSLDQLGVKHGTDKSSRHHNYLNLYDRVIGHLRHCAVNVLEIGVLSGASIRMWHDYFGEANIVGADINAGSVEHTMDRVSLVTADQSNVEDLHSLGIEHGPFDIIIDDGSHKWNDQITSLQYLFPFLKPGGYYILEDIDTSFGRYTPEFRGLSSISAAAYLQKLADYVIADSAVDIREVEDPFIRTYAPLIEFIMLARRTSITCRRA